MAAVAAGLGVAFLLGALVQRNWTAVTTPRGDETLAVGGPQGGESAGKTAVSNWPAARGNGEGERVRENSDGVSDEGEEYQAIDVPLVPVRQVDPTWFQRPPAALNEEMVRQLRGQGYAVAQQRQYVSVMLDNGHRAILPLDEAQIRFVGHKAWQ